MSSLVIVAIPAEDEVVYKVSSEKVPHLTLMYLGETSEDHNVARMAQFVEHALTVNQHGPFHLSVDYRGELGEDKADVLFFEGGWDTKWIKSLRSQLLKQSDIRAAYEAADTFPDWVPHLTLGYPDSPAKPLPNDYGKIYGVQFDRIAVWDGEYEGPEFRLRWPEREELEDMSVAWSLSEAGEEHILAHYGVKGMQWGVRKARPEGSVARGASRGFKNMTVHGSPALTRKVSLMGPFALFSPQIRKELKEMDKNVKLEKADKKWDKGLKDGSAWVAVNNASAAHFNKGIDAVNKKHPEDPKWGSEDPNNPTSPGYKKYMQDVNKLSADSIRAGVKELDMRNPSGTKEVEVIPGDLGSFRLKVKQVKHAADGDDEVLIKINYQKDAKGLVTGFTYSDDEDDDTLEQSVDMADDVEDDTLQQGAEAAGNILEHYGVKGMRWGVHRDDVERAAESSTSKVGAAVREASKFARDVEFESNTRPRKNSEGIEIDSVAKEKVVEEAATNFRKRDLPGIKSKPEYARAAKLRNRLLHPRDEMTKAYRKEVRETYIRRLENTANSMTNASGTRQYTIREKGGELPTSKYYWEVSTREAKHAADDDKPLLLEVLMDDDGFITGTKIVNEDIKQAMDFAEDVLAHYGVKGMRWGQRKEHARTGRKGETKKEWLDPEGHDLASDVVKAVLWPMVPPLGLFAIPAHIRLVRGGIRAGGSKIADMDEKRFEARAQSEKNFTEIHNRAAKRINTEIGAIDKKYPGDLTKNPEAKKRYDAEVLKATKSAYSDAAKSIGNKTSQNMHLEIEFKGNTDNFSIKAVEGRPTSQQKMRTQGIRHADDEEPEFEVTLEFSGKIKRDATGHILNLDFDGIEQKAPVQHSLTTAELGELFIEHYGVKGMRWGVRRRREPLAVEPMARSRVPHGRKRKTKIEVDGGENHPAADDAIAVAEAAAKLKKSGTKALSNRELQQIANRIELEDRVARATRSKGNKFVRELLEGETKSIVRGGVQSVTGTGGGKKKKK